MNLTKEIQKSLGPGILLAGAAIGGSHLVFSTQAGALYGFALFGLILLINLLKYPFLLVGTRFTASTGKSLLEGFKERNSYYLPLFLIVSLITGTITIAAVSSVSGALLQNFPLFSSFHHINLAIAILVISGWILIVGKYKALDRISKFLVALLTLLTFFAVVSLILKGSINQALDTSWIKPNDSPWKFSNLGFLIPLMGWMPCPLELCVWPSLWMFSRSKDSEYVPNVKEAEFDFNLGYIITVITAIFFLTLGAITMYDVGDGMLSGIQGSFAKKLIILYTNSIGDWSKWIIIPASFAAMFSTTITCLDAYPRSISAIQGLLKGTDLGHLDSKVERNRFQNWMIVHIFVSIVALLIAKSYLLTFKQFLFAATSGSFLTAPLFAWMAMDTINSNLVPVQNRYGTFLKTLSWIGLFFLIIFSFLYIANSFFGIGNI